MEAQQGQVLALLAVLLGVLAVLSLFRLALLRTSKRRAKAEHGAKRATEQAGGDLAKSIAQANAGLPAANHRLNQEGEVRRASEGAIAQSEDRFRVLFESSRDAMMTIEPPLWKFTAGNPATVTMFRAKDLEELTSCGPEDLSPERQPDGQVSSQKAKGMIEAALREGSNFFDWTHRRLNGEEFPATVLLTRMEYAGKAVVQATVRDVTEQKRAEEALREANEFNQQVIQSAREGIVVYGRDLRLRMWNPYMEQLTGILARDVLGRDPLEVFPFLREAGFVHRLEKILAGETPGPIEFPYQIAQTGRTGWASDLSGPLRNAGGEVVGIIGTVSDITDRKQAAESLLRDQARQLAMLELSQKTDLSAAEISKYAMEVSIELTGSTIGYIAFVNEDESVLTMHYWSKAAMGQCAVMNKPIVHAVKDTGLWGEAVRRRRAVITNDYAAPNPAKRGTPQGHVKLTRHMNIPVLDGGKIVAVAGVGNKETDYTQADVTQLTLMMEGMWRIICRKGAEEELRESREFLSKIVNCIRDPIFVMDDQDRFALTNDAWNVLHGRLREEVLGRTIADIFPPEIAASLIHRNQQVRATGGDDVTEELVVGNQGQELTVITKKSLYEDASGKRHVVGIIRDITESKKAEVEVRLAKVAAEQANAAKSAFLANMSHEIRTPMTAILGFAEMISESIECCTTCAGHKTCTARAQNKENIEVIRRNGEHLLEIINDILDLSKIEAGKMEAERVPCSPVQVVEDTASLMRVRAIEKGLTLDVRYEFPLPETILTDPARARQILMNLVGNAVKFTSHGGVEVSLRCVANSKEGRTVVVFDVKDTGIGMTPEQLGRLFRPFVQADSSTTRLFGGTGLGLAISKKLAEALGGDIRVVSQPGQGSTFTFTMEARLPAPARMLNSLAEAGERPSHRPQSARPACVELRGKVLLAEDGPDNQMLISRIVRKAGAEVDIVANGRLAVDKGMAALAAAAPYDAILMDMQMPEMDGYEATASLRHSGYTGPIVALTAHAMDGDRLKCLDAGCDDYVAKPVDRARLLATLARLMGSQSPHPVPAGAPASQRPQEVPADDVIRSKFAADPDMTELIETFLAGLPGTLNAMSESLANNCNEDLLRLAHQLKGAGGGYGYPQLTEQARNLEEAAKAADLEGARLALNELRASIRAAVAGRGTGSVAEGKGQ